MNIYFNAVIPFNIDFLHLLFPVPAESLRDLRVHIPETVIRGNDVVFN